MKYLSHFYMALLAIVTVVGFQNCGEGFNAASDSEDFLSSILTEKQILSGDMVLDVEDILVKGGDSNDEGTKDGQQEAATGLTTYRTKYWENGVIPVEFELTHRDRNYREKLFFQACAKWSAHANIKCVRRTDQSNYLLVRDTVKACNTQVGAGRYGGRRVFTFGLDWCWAERPLLHDIGHVLGLMHEHQRPDRDNYVDIKHEYIKSGFEHAYKKFSTADTKTNYDFESVMHYHAYAYSIHPNLAVMQPKSSYYSKISVMGRYTELSTLDKQLIKKMYPYVPVPTPTPKPTPIPTPTPTPPPVAQPVTCGPINTSFGQGCTYKSDTVNQVGSITKAPNITAGYTGSLQAECLGNGQYKLSNWTCNKVQPTPTPIPVQPTPTPQPVYNQACYLNGQKIAHGSFIKTYASSSVYYPQSCYGLNRYCNNGQLSGSSYYSHTSCTVYGSGGGGGKSPSPGYNYNFF